MTGQAIALMLVAVLIIWGGLAASVTALMLRGHREQREDRAAANARAHQHLRGSTS
ncbi:methionine/alanine import family NSS transporter small subunit [Actinomyces trachealis]|uniref:methionine/alanine import family NSS transporter small subunit n=1 Tax=Actinomyces trachealis TaxID=2763540 RepID=UPI001892BE78|nr:methionine/alanine import family NSS transporter small subunit [Actinomyces trachealis]